MEEGCGDREGKSGGGEEDMDVGECSEEEEDDEEDIDMGSSPIQQESSSLMDITSPVSTPYEGLASSLRMVPPTVLSAGKPLSGAGNLRRGPGRPRSRGAGGNSTPPAPRPVKKPAVGLKLKRWKGLLVSGVYGAGGGKNGNEGEADGESTSPSQPSTPVDQLKGPIFVDEPRFDEQWPGKTCVLCNLSEHSQLGQGKMIRAECALDELPRDLPRESLMSPPETPPLLDSTSPRPPLQNRRQKGFSKFSGQEPVDELSLVGHIDIPEPSSIIDAGFIYVHEWCAVWCPGVTRDENGQLLGLAGGVAAAAGRRCYHCSRYGAGPPCIVPSCNKHFHVPCAAAAATFQHVRTLILICSQHLDHVPINPNLSDVVCHSCNKVGHVTNLVMCSVCGNHHHGACIGNALQPGLRAGWQCIDCRVCQLCRESEDTGRMLVCESCDKAYHPHCVRPAMSSVPKVGWKCKRCRLCSDCGARTPGGGLSSRWHSNYTVCDSCYQQRNKGFSCPVCHKAYRAAALREMVKCSQCRRFVHGTCDKEADFVSYHRKKEAHPDYQYICLSCKNNSTLLYIKRKDSTEDVNIDSTLNVSQESLVTPEEADGDSEKSDETPMRLSAVGLGKGKPFYASKIAKKKLGLGPGRPKGTGKMTSVALSHYQKRPRYADFGRKRGAKTKMRGIFGVPGLGLQPSVNPHFY